MTKYVHWDEPGPDGKEIVHQKITVVEAIRRQHAAFKQSVASQGWSNDPVAPYPDTMALEDFLAIHCAYIVVETNHEET